MSSSTYRHACIFFFVLSLMPARSKQNSRSSKNWRSVRGFSGSKCGAFSSPRAGIVAGAVIVAVFVLGAGAMIGVGAGTVAGVARVRLCVGGLVTDAVGVGV